MKFSLRQAQLMSWMMASFFSCLLFLSVLFWKKKELGIVEIVFSYPIVLLIWFLLTIVLAEHIMKRLPIKDNRLKDILHSIHGWLQQISGDILSVEERDEYIEYYIKITPSKNNACGIQIIIRQDSTLTFSAGIAIQKNIVYQKEYLLSLLSAVRDGQIQEQGIRWQGNTISSNGSIFLSTGKMLNSYRVLSWKWFVAWLFPSIAKKYYIQYDPWQ